MLFFVLICPSEEVVLQEFTCHLPFHRVLYQTSGDKVLEFYRPLLVDFWWRSLDNLPKSTFFVLCNVWWLTVCKLNCENAKAPNIALCFKYGFLFLVHFLLDKFGCDWSKWTVFCLSVCLFFHQSCNIATVIELNNSILASVHSVSIDISVNYISTVKLIKCGQDLLQNVLAAVLRVEIWCNPYEVTQSNIHLLLEEPEVTMRVESFMVHQEAIFVIIGL